MALTQDDKQRLRWQCRRGMLELDLFFEPFYEAKFAELSEQQQATFAELLDCHDQDLFSWFIGSAQSENVAFQELISLIKAYRSSLIS